VTETLEARVRAHLAALRRRNLWRTLSPPTGVDLSSNDYLGLATHPAITAAMMDAVRRGGCGSTGSRLLRGEREAFSQVEQRFAAFKGAARSLYFSSGYLANLAVLTTFPAPGDLILFDERSHASLIDGARLSRADRASFPHNDTAALGRLLRERPPDHPTFVVTESLFSMDGDLAPIGEYAALCRETGATLVVDEAHAVGVYGRRGSGLLEEWGVSHDGWLSVNTAGKALGVSGAFVAGPDWAIEFLVQRARPFVFSTAAPPAVASALDASLTVIEAEPQRRAALIHLAGLMRRRLVESGIPVPPGTSPIVPIMLGENDRAVAVAAGLQADGFDARAIRPPTVAPGTARLRVSVNVGLDEATIDRFVAALVRELAGHPARQPAVSAEARAGQEEAASDAG